MTVCLTPRCDRERIPESAAGIRRAHCLACETRLLREAFGPIGWAERALTNTLPSLVVGGVPIEPLDPTLTVAACKCPSGAAAVSSAPSGSLQPARAG